ncbi:hypothetical protein PC129_g9120 [Phytophthora cactorum]|uniref:Alpha-L-rhamnosidase six-hairpin glycosidase domain-containing protein n=1 Tax=Phytophthora cactorum TaxID=29920 RepID=A0A329RVZ7_9STRA|nr:hypothetical protein PC112_g13593 [Phytophthora cactorum]KAG2824869.1 hypothetical protein PC111_g9637 [Phytophthora cactorum]KAG2853680.1 hypothetical protein PC113_g13974 [Phytophthora cactorum]KAG2902963.1 hypothetical protein PC114_g12476 [Phytophthora cactorum]KAG2918202.1 hypothetical protein PC115_g10545 [Phytophthora cactorum]
MKFQSTVALFTALAAISISSVISTPGSWNSYIQSPASRDVVPENIIETSGNVKLSESNPGSQLGVAFSENKRYIGTTSDRATGPLVDGTLYAPAEPESTFTFGREFGRGGFRYLTVSTSPDATVEVTGISTLFTAAPSTEDDKLREYSGYFYSDDDLLNRIWYAGASPPAITAGWANNATIENVSVDAEVFVDGAKRDRTPWPGDYGVATLSKAVPLNGDNLLSVRNALESIIAMQASNGEFPYAGTPLGRGYQEAGTNSDTYHLWTLIAVADYTMLSNDQTFVTGVWDRIQRGFEFTLAKGGKNPAANSLLYNALVSYVKLADELGYGELSYAGKLFSEIAKDLKRAVNVKLWDASVGFFRDNTTALGAEFYPQDGDVLVVHFNVTESLERSATISQSLATRWNEFGAVSPEALGSISPFMTSLEIDAHLRANPGNATLAMEIMRRQWNYMLNNFSNSTTIEAYYYTGELKYPFYEAVEKNLGSYISHAHAWSTGPTASLTLQIGGLSPLKDAGKKWEFVPHAAGSNVGQLQTGYTLATDTTGSISVPTFGKSLDSIEISINGNIIWSNDASLWGGLGLAKGSDDYVTVSDVSNGGSFTIVAKEVGSESGLNATSC